MAKEKIEKITISTDDPEPSLRKQLIIVKICKRTLSLNRLFWSIMCILTSTLTHAVTTRNIGLTSNYLWRGVTQSNTSFAESGGLEYSNINGFFLGLWVSTLNAGSYELDLYGGFTKKTNDFRCSIAYTVSSKDNTCADFSQVDLYYTIGAGKALDNGIGINILMGRNSFDNPNGDYYNHLNFNVSKNNFNFALNKTNNLLNNNDFVTSLFWSKSFNLRKKTQ